MYLQVGDAQISWKTSLIMSPSKVRTFNCSKVVDWKKHLPCKYLQNKTKNKTAQIPMFCREIPMFCFFVLKTKLLSESWMRKTHFSNTETWFFVGFPEAFKGDIAVTRWLIWAAENGRLFVAKTHGTMVIFPRSRWRWIQMKTSCIFGGKMQIFASKSMF